MECRQLVSLNYDEICFLDLTNFDNILLMHYSFCCKIVTLRVGFVFLKEKGDCLDILLEGFDCLRDLGVERAQTSFKFVNTRHGAERDANSEWIKPVWT